MFERESRPDQAIFWVGSSGHREADIISPRAPSIDGAKQDMVWDVGHDSHPGYAIHHGRNANRVGWEAVDIVRRAIERVHDP